MAVTQEEFAQAVAVIHKALLERVVARGLTSTYNYTHTVVDEVVISRHDSKPRATYYYDESDGYNERRTMGSQSNFDVTVMDASERLKLDLKDTKAKYQAALRNNIDQEMDLVKTQSRLRALELEVARLSK